MKTLLILIFLISNVSASDLSDYMDKENFKPPPNMQEIIEEGGLTGWKGTVYTLDGRQTYFVLEYAVKGEVEKAGKNEYATINILCILIFSYEEKRCVKAIFFDKNGKDHKIDYNRYNRKRA